MSKSEPTIQELSDRLELLGQEVDALQVALMRGRTPWYRDIPTIFSVLALVFSLGTTYVSYKRTETQDILAARAELRALLQRLAALPKENLEITRTYANDAASLNFISGYIGQENSLLARQAAEIAGRLPSRQITSAEYHAISLALWNAGDAMAALPFAEAAARSATEAASAANALRAYGADLFTLGQAERGRAQYQEALNIFAKYPNYNDYFQGYTHILTQLSWANAEASGGFMDLAWQHLEAAESLVASLPTGPSTDQLRQQAEQQRALYASQGE